MPNIEEILEEKIRKTNKYSRLHKKNMLKFISKNRTEVRAILEVWIRKM